MLKLLQICLVASFGLVLISVDAKDAVKRDFRKISEAPDGTQLFEATVHDANLPGKSIDHYSINCKYKIVTVTWGPTTGGATGITLPGGGSAIITNLSDKNELLSMACK
jgi:hypothetical protein